MRSVVEKESIECQLVQNNAYVFGINAEEWDTLVREYETAKRIGIDAELLQNADFPSGNKGLLAYKGQYVFHPVRYVDGLARAAAAKGAVIYGDTKAVRLADGDIKRVECENDITIRARHVVMATQYPFYDGPNFYFARLYPKRTYGIAVRAKKDWLDGSYINAGNPSRRYII